MHGRMFDIWHHPIQTTSSMAEHVVWVETCPFCNVGVLRNKDRSCEVVVFTHPVQCLLHQINAGHWKWCTDKRPTRHLLVILTVWPVLSQLHHEPSRNSSQRHRCHHTTHLLSLKPAQPSQPYGSTSQDKKPPRESLCLCCFVGNHWPMRLYGIVCMKRSSVVAKDPDWGANCRMICKRCS